MFTVWQNTLIPNPLSARALIEGTTKDWRGGLRRVMSTMSAIPHSNGSSSNKGSAALPVPTIEATSVDGDAAEGADVTLASEHHGSPPHSPEPPAVG